MLRFEIRSHADPSTATRVYSTTCELTPEQAAQVAAALGNPVADHALVRTPETRGEDVALFYKGLLNAESFIEIMPKPGVTDDEGKTARGIIEDTLGFSLPGDDLVTSSTLYAVEDAMDAAAFRRWCESKANPIMFNFHTKSGEQFFADGGMDFTVPRVRLPQRVRVLQVDLACMTDAELTLTGKEGIMGEDGIRRGPLGLSLNFMRAIRKRYPVLPDIALELIAQTWSEHCKHNLFNWPMDDDVREGIFKKFIRGATEYVRMQRGKDDICVSVFTGNAGIIRFVPGYNLAYKMETHNSPSALDPFGGAITGINGVNRDIFAEKFNCVANLFWFCFGYPEDTRVLYRKVQMGSSMLSPRAIMDGVIKGVEVGGNCTGIPTPLGGLTFDHRYSGKPLVFCGSLGLAAEGLDGGEALPGDLIVMIGGRVGADGIHGATFSSEALDTGSPMTAVQIGAPYSQKKMSDALLEAVQLGYVRALTDNGAGGLGSSVFEMAKKPGGAHLCTSDVPLKYPGLVPYEILISEAQERMTLAVSPACVTQLLAFFASREVEATVIGIFTDDGRAVVLHEGEVIMDLDMDFLHNGTPVEHLHTTWAQPIHVEPTLPEPDQVDHAQRLLSMLERHNVTSREFIHRKYDHEVQGGSALKPLQGVGEVCADVAAVMPLLGNPAVALMSLAANPRYGEIDTLHMARVVVDEAVRNIIAAGGSLDHLALMDNFCWCSPDDPFRLGQLKRAAMGCYDAATAFLTPYISGKDSMHNDFKGFDENDNPLKISIPPTLLISSVGVVDDVHRLVSMDAKIPGDAVYVLGQTLPEMGGSEYYAALGAIGNIVPHVNFTSAARRYKTFSEATRRGLVASAMGVGKGGLAVALAKKAIAGQLGIKASLFDVSKYTESMRFDHLLYSESASRLLVTVSPQHRSSFEVLFEGQAISRIGEVTPEPELAIYTGNGSTTRIPVATLATAYRSTFRSY